MEPKVRFRLETGPSGEARRTGIVPKPTLRAPYHPSKRVISRAPNLCTENAQ